MSNVIKLADDVKLLLEKDAQQKGRTLSEVANEILRERLTIKAAKAINQGGLYPDTCIADSELPQQLMEHISQPPPNTPNKSVTV